jgi:membrane fusion protein, multidrug efflux system
MQILKLTDEFGIHRDFIAPGLPITENQDRQSLIFLTSIPAKLPYLLRGYAQKPLHRSSCHNQGGPVSWIGSCAKASLAIRRSRLIWLLPALSAFSACTQKNTAPRLPPPEVAVIKVAATPVTVYQEYAAQAEAVDTVEIRSRVSGILERQAFLDGANVKSGDLLFVLDQQPYIAALTQARANLAQAQAAHLNSRQNLARLRPLLADQAISQQDLDAAIAKESADAAGVTAAQAQVKQADLNLGYTMIRAPRAGVMSKALIKTGGLVNASSTLLATLYSIDPIYVSFTISEQNLAQLQKQFDLRGQKNSAPPFSLKLIDGSDYQYQGKLNFVDTAVDPKNGTLQVRLSVPNPERALRPGQFVRVAVPAERNQNAILVPQQAVQELQGKHSVFVIGADNKAVYRDIGITMRMGNNWVVERGLKAGEMVVVEGTSKVKPGAPVKPVQLAQNANGP